MDGQRDTRIENERAILRERTFHCLILLEVPNQPTCRKASEVTEDTCDPPLNVRVAEFTD